MPGRTGATQPQQSSNTYNPCNNPRQATDVAGRFSDLVNCYIVSADAYLKVYLPLAIIAIILLAVMLFAVRELVKE